MNLRLDIKILKLWPKLVDHYSSSQTFPVASITDKGIIIKNSFGSNIFKLLFLTIYYVSFGKSKYLSVTNGI